MANAYLPALDDYADAAMPLNRLMNRHRPKTKIRPVPGEWPTFKGRHTCHDATGRWREKHSYIVECRRGTECVYCGRLRPWEHATGFAK